MTLQNVVDFLQANGKDLFENCTTPEPIDMNLVKDYIMLRCGLLTPVYGEPELMKQQVKMWFDKEQWEFSHLVKILLAEYDIIDNVDEYEEWHEKHSGTDQRKLGGKEYLSGSDKLIHGETHTLSGTDELEYDTQDVHSGEDTDTDTTGTEHKVSAFNSSVYQADSKDENSGTVEHSFDSSMNKTGTETTTFGKTDTASGTDETQYGKTTNHDKTDDLTHGENIDYFRRRHGNIGLETPSDIIMKELDMLERFNVYDWIARKFERDNMIEVY